tara:strand:- start:34 stop:177 length:144 start_codon:yes stop_codon:yes gene_type:complete
MNKQKEEISNKKLEILKEQEKLQDKKIEKSYANQHIRVLDEDDGYHD